MPDQIRKTEENNTSSTDCRTIVPPGAPAWVTDELIQDTLDTFQSHFQKTLTPEDALEMLVDATNLMEFLLE